MRENSFILFSFCPILGVGIEVDDDVKFNGDVMETEDIFADLLRYV